MNYKTTVDGIDFIFDEALFQNELKRLLLRYKYSCNSFLNSHCFLSLVNLDNIDARKYLVKNLKENIDNLCAMNFSMKDIQLNDISKHIKQDKIPVIVYNLEEFYPTFGAECANSFDSSFGEVFWSEFKTKFANSRDIGRFFTFHAINMARDGVFLENNATFFLVLSDKDYLEFTYDVGDDFASYCQIKVDFNTCFISKDNISLSEYYKDKGLPKSLKK